MSREGWADWEDGVHDIVSKGIEAASKFLSYVLRHKPETTSLELDLVDCGAPSALCDGQLRTLFSAHAGILQAKPCITSVVGDT